MFELNGLVVSPVRAGEFSAIKEAAEKDNNVVIFPSHVVRKYGEIVGYVSVCSMPVYTSWMHTQKVSARDSHCVANKVDDFMRMKGHPSYVIGCDDSSNYKASLEKRYPQIAKLNLFERVF